MINEYLDPNYLDNIKSKLDRMNKVNGFDPSQPNPYQEPYKVPDMMDQMGQTAIQYIKSQGKDLNGNPLPPELILS